MTPQLPQTLVQQGLLEQWQLQGSGENVVWRFGQQESGIFHATVIPSRITPFSSDHGRQTGLGQISTTLGDHAGISGAVAFCSRQSGAGGAWEVHCSTYSYLLEPTRPPRSFHCIC